MRVEALFLLFIAVYCAVIAVIYWLTSYEDGGTTMLAASCLLGLLPGAYYFWWSRRMTPRAEDNPRATPADGAGVVGAFPSSSVWPFVLGAGLASIGLALVFGSWTAVFGGALVITVVVGVIAESRRGGIA